MLLLFALIFRAVAIEFRSKEAMPWWRSLWDRAFCVSSILASILFGVAIGNLIVGLPIGSDMEFTGGFFDLLSPYAILVGVFNLSLFAMHGSIYLYLKTEGELQAKAKKWIHTTFTAFVILYVLTTVFTLTVFPQMIANFKNFPWVWVIVGLNVLAIANIPRALYLGHPLRAFLSSCCAIAALVFLFGIGVFPNMIVSSLDPAFNLTIYNAASSQKTLGIMLVIALMGLPCVLSYTGAIYWIFRGKVKLDEYGY